MKRNMKPIQIQFSIILIIFSLTCIFEVSTAPARNRTRPAKTSKTTTATTILTTVPSPCENVTCYNDGRCLAFGDQWMCACKQGFIGEKCETNYTEYIAELASSEEPSPCDGITCPGGILFMNLYTYTHVFHL